MLCNCWRTIGFAASVALFTSLGGCVIEPLGGGHGGGGREHDDHGDHDRGDEHRHDFGVRQGGHIGLIQPPAITGESPGARPAVFLPFFQGRRDPGLWA